jgi:hypothetical protein
MRLALGADAAPPAQQPPAGSARGSGSGLRAAALLGLLASHPLVQASLAPPGGSAEGARGAAGAAVQAAVAFSTVELLRQQLGSARGGDLAGLVAACGPLLHRVAAAFLPVAQQAQQAQQAAPLGAAAAGGSAGRAAALGKEGKRQRIGQGPPAATDVGSEGGLPPAAYHWTVLLPWMGTKEVESAALALLSGSSSWLGAVPGEVQPGAVWAAEVTVATISQLLSGHSGHSTLGSSLLHLCCDTLVRLVVSSQNSR